MGRHFGLIVLPALLASIAGCDKLSGSSDQAPGGVAVIDLDEIARRTGRNLAIEAEVAERSKLIESQLVGLEMQVKEQLVEKSKEYGENPSEQQQQELRTLQAEVRAKLRQAHTREQRNLVAFQQELIRKFREEMTPVAREVARSQGLSVIVPKDKNLILSVEPTAEITEEVIKQLSTARAENETPAAVVQTSAESPAPEKTAEAPAAEATTPETK